MEIMSVPRLKDVASLLLSEDANHLAHASVGVRRRFWTNAFLGFSALLGCVAGSTGLADLLSKTWVSVIALAATLSTTIVILFLTMFKYDAHLRVQAKYQDLYMRTLGCDVTTAKGLALYKALYDEFMLVARESNQEAPLSNRQVTKFENKARKKLPTEIGDMKPPMILTDARVGQRTGRSSAPRLVHKR